MKDKSKLIKKRYNRIAKFYDILEKPMEFFVFSNCRDDIFKNIKGKVLEVGVGTGKNIEYYPKNIEFTAIDFSSEMLKKAKFKAFELDREVNFIEMDAQYMTFDDNTFDVIIVTCVFCSVPDPIMGLKEIRRVCKPNGKVIMIEHVRSEKKILGYLMDILNPLVVKLYGANINRRTIENIKESGFSNVEVNNLSGDILKKIVLKNTKNN